ncbi:hypothetical protein Leryth_002718 [Lithospermum erythrorhizon]|nr:hypothetical protein Leryth_002718 [Lithospermum erythrorhizon]
MNNKLFVQTLRAPNMLIFPKGLVHYQINTRSDKSASGLGMFGGASAGTVSLPKTIFGSGIPGEILAKAFKTDDDTITSLIKSNK